MKYTYKNTQGFTLIELLVSITIFSIIIVSVITIFIFSANLSAKVDINRAMQENIKNAVETIAEDVRKSDRLGAKDAGGNCDYTSTGIREGNKLCICVRGSIDSITNQYSCEEQTIYTLKKTPDLPGSDIFAVNDMNTVIDTTNCNVITSHCRLFQDNINPLTNSFVSFRDINFYLFGDANNQDKLSINFRMQPSIKKGVRSDLIKNSELIFQTTISKRLIENN